MDVEIQEGKIVEKITEKDVKELDAGGRILVPGGIDPHARLGSHVARLVGIYSKEWTAGNISKEYLRAGYTFAASADVSLMDIVSTTHFLSLIKGLDSGILLSIGSLWMLALDYQQGNTDSIAGSLAYFGSKLYPLGVQVSRPFAPEYWHWEEENTKLEVVAKHFEVSPEKVIIEALKSAKIAGFHAKSLVELPIENQPNNLDLIKNHLTRLDPEKLPYHLVQGHYYAQQAGTVDGESLAKILVEHDWISTDAGCGIPKEKEPYAITSRTFSKSSTTGMRGTFELDQDVDIGIRTWHLQNKPDAQSWFSSLELLLSGVEKHMPIALSFDSPNFGLPHDFGHTLSMLASKSLRDALGPKIVGPLYNKSKLKGMTPEVSLESIIQLTRVFPGQILGIDGMKGHLAPGADADVCIFNLKPEDPIKEDSFAESWVTIKGGRIVWKNNTLGTLPPSKVLASKINAEIITDDIVKKREKWFQKYSSINMASLYLPDTEHIVKV